MVEIVAQICSVMSYSEGGQVISKTKSSIPLHIRGMTFGSINLWSAVLRTILHVFQEFIQTSHLCRTPNRIICIFAKQYQAADSLEFEHLEFVCYRNI